MSTLNTLAAAAVLALPLVSAETWGWTSSENVCAGIITDCTDQTSCTTTGVGPCTGKDTVAPTAYLKSSLVGLAFVDDDKVRDQSPLSAISLFSETNFVMNYFIILIHQSILHARTPLIVQT